MAGIFNSSIFNNAIFNTGDASPVVVDSGGGGGRKRTYPKKPKYKVIRWSDFAHQEERAEALAKVLAESAIPIKVVADDPFADEDEAIIHALLLSRILH